MGSCHPPESTSPSIFSCTYTYLSLLAYRVSTQSYLLCLRLSRWLPEACFSVSLGCWSHKSCACVSGGFSPAPEHPIKWKGIHLHRDSGHLSDKSPSLWGHPQEQERTEGLLPMIVRDTIFWQLPWDHQQRKEVTNRLHYLELASRVVLSTWRLYLE